MPVAPGRLAGTPVFVAQGDADTVIPRELLDRTWDYLHGGSGALAHGRREAGGDGITADTVADLADGVAEVLSTDTFTAPGPSRTTRGS